MTKLLVFITNANFAMNITIEQTYELTYPLYCIYYINQRISNSNFVINTKILVVAFINIIIACVKNFFMKGSSNLLKNILV